MVRRLQLTADRREVRLRSIAGWADSATYTMSDLTMLRRELVIGYTVAGLLAVLVPTSVWHTVFITGHGFWTSVENAIVGPFIAIISFVCSIGNVPLAAALWSGGISFGGVIAFIFADLIAFPLLLIYRRYYGTRLMLRMLAVFWALMSTAGLITEGLFRAAGLVPTHASDQSLRCTSRGTTPPTSTSSSWRSSASSTGYTAIGSGWGAGDRYAARPGLRHAGRVGACTGITSPRRGQLYFCSDHCAERFNARENDAASRHRERRTHLWITDASLNSWTAWSLPAGSAGRGERPAGSQRNDRVRRGHDRHPGSSRGSPH